MNEDIPNPTSSSPRECLARIASTPRSRSARIDLRIDRSKALLESLETCCCLLISKEDVEERVVSDVFFIPHPSSLIPPHASFR
jgi:hypothetical protein